MGEHKKWRQILGFSRKNLALGKDFVPNSAFLRPGNDKQKNRLKNPIPRLKKH